MRDSTNQEAPAFRYGEDVTKQVIEMNEINMQNLLQEVLEHEDEECGTESKVKSVGTYSECGVLTTNKGLVVSMKDGSEFHITIVQSR